MQTKERTPVMFTPPTSSTPLPAGTPTAHSPVPSNPDHSAAFQEASPASTAAGAAPTPINPLSNGFEEGRGDATWPVILKSPTGLDGDAQRLVRSLLTKAAGKRLARRRHLDDTLRQLWEPTPDLADFVRQYRYYAPGLYRFHTPDIYGLLYTEARLTLEVIETAPGVLGVEVWQELLELQCRRIGQLYTELQRCLGYQQAQAALQRLLEGLV